VFIPNYDKKNLNYKLGWNVTSRFRLELHIRDLELLYSIQSFFKGIGQIGIISTRKLAYFEVTKLNDLVNMIIPHFEQYPLQSAKSIDFQIWKKCVVLIKNKEHLTEEGLHKIIHLKSAINLGLSETLKAAFPHVNIMTRPVYIVPSAPLNPYWVSGFVDGTAHLPYP